MNHEQCFVCREKIAVALDPYSYSPRFEYPMLLEGAYEAPVVAPGFRNYSPFVNPSFSNNAGNRYAICSWRCHMIVELAHWACKQERTINEMKTKLDKHEQLALSIQQHWTPTE